MITVSVENEWGVVDGASREERAALEEELHTETKVVGTRLKFLPCRHALDHLVKVYGAAAFQPGCRFAWAHFYRKEDPRELEFSFKTQPYPHQRLWWSRIKDLPFFALEWDMGLGKSKLMCDVLSWAATQHDLDGALVVSLKDVHRQWVEEQIPEHMAIPHKAAYWNSNRVEAGMRGIIEAREFAVAAINFDVINRKNGNAFARKFLKRRKAALIVDESQTIKTPSSERTKALLKLADFAERRYILTGTLITASPLDAWAQYQFLDPAILGMPKFHQYKARYAVEKDIPGTKVEVWQKNPVTGRSEKIERPAREIVAWQNLEELKGKLDPFRSRLLKDDVLDLPPKTYRLRSFEMSGPMRKAYVEMQNELRTELEGGRSMTASMAMTKLIRLQQIVCGFVVPDDLDPEVGMGEPLPGKNPRLEAMLSTCEEINGKAIIWANWRYSLAQIADALRTAYGDASVVEYHGGVSAAAKARNKDEFLRGDARWFVANAASAGTGLNLTVAQDTIYYSNSYNYGQRKQSEDRNYRIGQTGTVTITDLEALGTVDRNILHNLRDKHEVASELSGDTLRSWLSAAA